MFKYYFLVNIIDKKRKMEQKSLFFVMFVLIMIGVSGVFVSAGLSNWWNSFTGEATSDVASVTVTLASTAPNIITMSASQTPSGTAGTTTRVSIVYQVHDPDGADDLTNGTKERVNFTYGGVTHSNTSCDYKNGTGADGTTLNTTSVWYHCSALFDYWDEAAAWTINIMANDSANNQDIDSTTTATYQALNGMSMNMTAFTFPSVAVTSTNVGASTTTYISNLGNKPQWTSVTGKHLLGYTTPADMIVAGQFSVDDVTAGCSGTALVNATSVNITAAAAVAQASGAFGARFICLTSVYANLTAQAYNTTAYGTWTWATTIS